MKGNLFFIIFVIICLGILAWVFLPKDKVGNLISPEILTKKTAQPTVTPKPTPQTFEFSNSTNLESELETINPATQDSDFADLLNLNK